MTTNERYELMNELANWAMQADDALNIEWLEQEVALPATWECAGRRYCTVTVWFVLDMPLRWENKKQLKISVYNKMYELEDRPVIESFDDFEDKDEPNVIRFDMVLEVED